MAQTCTVLQRHLYFHFASLRPLSLVLVALMGCSACQAEGTVEGVSDSGFEDFLRSDRVEGLLVSMTFEDKVGEMTQLTAYKHVFVDPGATKTLALHVYTSELGFLGHDYDVLGGAGCLAFGLATRPQNLN